MLLVSVALAVPSVFILVFGFASMTLTPYILSGSQLHVMARPSFTLQQHRTCFLWFNSFTNVLIQPIVSFACGQHTCTTQLTSFGRISYTLQDGSHTNSRYKAQGLQIEYMISLQHWCTAQIPSGGHQEVR
jgi:hypothetical protein